MTGECEEIQGIKIINGPTRDILNEVKLVDYGDYKSQLIEWLLNEGKHLDRAEGYAKTTVRQVSQKTDRFYRWLWVERGQYTTEMTPEDAAEYMDSLVYDDEEYSNSHMASIQKCLKRVFKWQRHRKGTDHEWEPDRSFPQSATRAPDYLTMDERRKIREAALEYGSIPSYNSITPKERKEWRIYFAQRFEKPVGEVKPED